MDSQLGFKQDLVQHLINVHVGLLEFLDFVTEFSSQLQSLLSDFLITLRKDKRWILLELFSEFLYHFGLIEICSLWLIEKRCFFSFFDEDQFEIVEPLLNKLQMREMAEAFLYHFHAFVCICVYSVSLGVN